MRVRETILSMACSASEIAAALAHAKASRENENHRDNAAEAVTRSRVAAKISARGERGARPRRP